MSIVKNIRRNYSLKTEMAVFVTALFMIFVFGLLSLFYGSYSGSVESTYIDQVISTSQLVLANYANYTDDVVTVSDAVQKKLDNLDVENGTDQVISFFDDMLLLYQEVDSIVLYDYDGNVLSKNTYYQERLTPTEIQSQNWFVAALNAPLVNAFSKIDDATTFTLSKAISLEASGINALLRIQYDFIGLTSIIDQENLGDNGHIYIFDNDYKLVYASQEISSEEKTVINNQVLGGFTYEEEGNQFYLYLSSIPNTRWRVCIATNINEIINARNSLLLNSLIFSILALIAFILLIFVVCSNITKPLVRLQTQMAAVESLDFQLKTESKIQGTREIAALNRSYQTMMRRIQHLAQKVIDEQKEQNKAELKALQNQINPHFLYNTLDSIIYLIDEGKNEQAEEMIVALSRFFRISISKGKNIIPVKSELEHVQYYLQIQKVRFGSTFVYSIDAEKEVYDYYVIKLILQPIVENAIVHGIGENTTEPASIDIRAYVKDEFLYFEIEDSGYGMLPEKIEEIYASFKDKTVHNGVGLSNVYQRIKIYYGEQSDIKIESEPDKGSKITIIIPKKEAMKNEEK